MSDADPVRDLDGLLASQRRYRPPRDLGVREAFERLAGDAERQHRRVGVLVEVWSREVPAALLPHTRLVSFQRGILTVGVDDSATLYELDRLLRSGLDATLIAAHRASGLRRIKLALVAGDLGT